MNRNVITVADIAAQVSRRAFDSQRRLDLGGGSAPLGGQTPASAVVDMPDVWYERLVKCIPAEALSFYLALDRGVRPTDTHLPDPNLVYLLGAALACSLFFNVLYLRLVWKVRASQVCVSTAALLAYVYVTGGFFEVAGLSQPRIQMFVLIVTAGCLSLFKPFGPEPPIAATGVKTPV
jgi:hypothetical protein